MKIQPVEQIPAPGYPDKSRWLAAPLAVGLTAAMALGLNACGQRAAVDEPAPIPTETCTVQTPSTTEYIIMGDFPVPAPESTTTARPSTNTRRTTTTTARPTTTEYVVMGDFPVPVTEPTPPATEYVTMGTYTLVAQQEN